MQEFTIHLMVALNCFNVFSGLGKDSKGCEVGAWNQVKERFNNFILFSFRFINFSFHLFTFSFWFFVFYLLCLHIISCFFFIQYTWYSNYMAYNLQWGFIFFLLFFLRLCTLFELATNWIEDFFLSLSPSCAIW